MGNQINDGAWAEMKQINEKAERITAINVLILVLHIAIFMMGK